MLPLDVGADVEIAKHARLSTSIDEFDRVLGGGLVRDARVHAGELLAYDAATLKQKAVWNVSPTNIMVRAIVTCG